MKSKNKTRAEEIRGEIAIHVVNLILCGLLIIFLLDFLIESIS